MEPQNKTSDWYETPVAPTIKVKKLSELATIPTRNNLTDAGLDLYSIEDHTLKPLERRLFKTNISLELPHGYYGRICDRSGNALKKGLHILGGCIDEGYSGDVGVILVNINGGLNSIGFSSLYNEVKIKKGDKIAQIVIEKYHVFPIEIVDELSDSARKDKGFGSSDTE